MSFSPELKKLKRTGYLPAVLGGAVLAGAFPVLNMLVRPETFTAQPGEPFSILLKANWQMMAMLNTLILICGACMMYHSEFADNGMQKMEVLPVRQSSIFLGKFFIAAASLAVIILLETAVLAGCVLHWFPDHELCLSETVKNAGFALMASLPTVMLMLAIASACRNIWISLGIGVILVFTFSVFPDENPLLALCPFRSPFQTLAAAAENGEVWTFSGVCIGETVLFGMAEELYIKIRRCVS